MLRILACTICTHRYVHSTYHCTSERAGSKYLLHHLCALAPLTKSMRDKGGSPPFQQEDLLITNSHSSWKRGARRDGESPLPSHSAPPAAPLCLILHAGELGKSLVMPERWPYHRLLLKATFAILKKEGNCAQTSLWFDVQDSLQTYKTGLQHSVVFLAGLLDLLTTRCW